MFKLNTVDNTVSFVMTESEFNKIITNEPGLTSDGLEENSLNNGFEEKREVLSQSFDEFKICCEWINTFRTEISKKKLKDHNFLKHNINSYYLKHAIEKWAGEYIPNGALIAALIHFGISYKQILGSPDVAAFIILDRDTPFL